MVIIYTLVGHRSLGCSLYDQKLVKHRPVQRQCVQRNTHVTVSRHNSYIRHNSYEISKQQFHPLSTVAQGSQGYQKKEDTLKFHTVPAMSPSAERHSSWKCHSAKNDPFSKAWTKFGWDFEGFRFRNCDMDSAAPLADFCMGCDNLSTQSPLQCY